MKHRRTPSTSLLRRCLPPALLVVALLALTGGTGAAAGTTERQSAPVFPGAEWETVADPRSAGYCTPDFAEATAHVKTLPTTAVMAIVGGRVLWQYGDVEAVSYLASVRKSILATMYGRYVVAGRIRLNANMMELGIDEVNGLLPVEKLATVEDLLTARSGVYHEAANAACTGCGSTAGDPPGARGTVPRGTSRGVTRSCSSGTRRWAACAGRSGATGSPSTAPGTCCTCATPTCAPGWRSCCPGAGLTCAAAPGSPATAC